MPFIEAQKYAYKQIVERMKCLRLCYQRFKIPQSYYDSFLKNVGN